MTVFVEKKQLVAPGELIAEGQYYAGANTYMEGGRIFASKVGLVELAGNKVYVMQLAGGYIPSISDFVIGRIMDVGMSGWPVDILAPYPALLPASETRLPRVGMVRRDLATIFNVGDLLAAEVIAFDRTRDPLITTKGRGLGKVAAGRVARISSSRIPRLIGRQGSMISMLKRETDTQILAGQNGVVLVSGKNEKNERAAIAAIYMIEREAHTAGLTDRVTNMIRKELTEG